MEIDVTAVRDGSGDAVLLVTGSVDLASKGVLLDAGLRELDRDGCRRLVLDLSGVAFMDSSGIAVLINLDNEAQTRGIQVAMREPSNRVTRLLALTGLGSRFPLVSDPSVPDQTVS